MALRFRPGCLVRSMLAMVGVLFLPLGVWFLWADPARYWARAVPMLLAAIVCLVLAFDRREKSWLAMVDDLE